MVTPTMQNQEVIGNGSVSSRLPYHVQSLLFSSMHARLRFVLQSICCPPSASPSPEFILPLFILFNYLVFTRWYYISENPSEISTDAIFDCSEDLLRREAKNIKHIRDE